MGEKLPAISGQDARKAFERAGFECTRQRGSHMILRHTTPPHRRLVIPDHREIAKGTLRAIIRDAGLTVDEFVELLRG